jgi:hypothetical protein
MIYTVGWRESYQAGFRSGEPFRKKGRAGDFPGGSVWRTRAEAAAHAGPGYSVYGVRADWETETAPSDGGPWHDLLVDAELVDLGSAEGGHDG